MIQDILAGIFVVLLVGITLYHTASIERGRRTNKKIVDDVIEQKDIDKDVDAMSRKELEREATGRHNED